MGGGETDNTDNSSWFGKIIDSIVGLPNRILEGLESTFKDITQFLSYIFDALNYINPFSDDFILKDVLSFLGNILSYINPFSDNFFGNKIIELLSDLLQFLFIPSEEYISALTDSVSNKFAFIDTIKDTINLLQDMFNNDESLPKLTLTLKNNKWFEGEITVFDLSWYSPYKEYGDLIISAFIYVFFIWRLFINLPSIIGGLSGVSDLPKEVSDIEAYSKFGFGRRGKL